MSTISIELGDGSTFATCECCGSRAPSVVGYVYKDGDAFAAYYAGWTEGHAGDVSLVIGIGDWDDAAPEASRRSFGLRCWVEGDDIDLEVLDPEASRYRTVTSLGRMLSREAALKDPMLPEIFHVAEHIVHDDPRVRAALDSSTS